MFPQLVSDRLILRPPCAKDMEPWTAVYQDPEQNRYVGGPIAPNAAVQRFLASAGAWAILEFGPFSVIEKATGAWVGCVGPSPLTQWPGQEFGWRLTAAGEGRGLATEAAFMALDWTFNGLGRTEVVHTIHRDNQRSHALAERLGSVRVGPVQGPPPHDRDPMIAWTQTAQAWNASDRHARARALCGVP